MGRRAGPEGLRLGWQRRLVPCALLFSGLLFLGPEGWGLQLRAPPARRAFEGAGTVPPLGFPSPAFLPPLEQPSLPCHGIFFLDCADERGHAVCLSEFGLFP